jgi:diaminohydroxyphosphoribosylaminopyrimidine deaminase/5-amino-6-(5-phosphoribosylamino)uracil reductase
MLRFPSKPLKLEHHELLTTLHAGGVRRLLLDGGPDLAAPFLADDLVDHIVAYLPDLGPSSHPPLTGQEPMVAHGFHLTGVTRLPDHVQIKATRPFR